VIFALPAIVLMLVGINHSYDYRFFIGIGITIYGVAYFFVHDLFIHQRLKISRNTENPYLLAIRRAHKQHHKHVNKEHGECYGFLWVPIKYFKMYFSKEK
jgi:beta-carotene 3-hydroxylase